ncbi:MAG TPA: hypothetical protein VFX80_06830 [Solirubrobacteraceae bacterium]|nr:hypothetical protein [Solirubrobacteraceae bacterium]
MGELPEELFQRWMHAREEDEGDVRVYRPSGYALPPARGRRGLEFKPDGELVVIGPGPTDRPQAVSGSWQSAGEHRARVSLPAAEEPQEVEIVSVEPDRLALRWS